MRCEIFGCGKDQIELHVVGRRPDHAADGNHLGVGPIEIGRPEDDLGRLGPGPGGRAVAGQAEGVAALLVEVAEDAGRDGQIEAQLRRHLRQPAELGVALVQLRRQIDVLRPLQIMHGEAGRNHQRRIARRTRQRKDALQLQVVRCPCRRCRRGRATWRRTALSGTRRFARPAEAAARRAEARRGPRRSRPAIAESRRTNRDATPVAPAATARPARPPAGE